MVVFKALKRDERNKILSELTLEQSQAYWNVVAYRASDRLLTRIFQGSAAWRFFALNIDYEWDRNKNAERHSQPLKCMCKRHLRYQYEFESVSNPKQHVFLGSTHFAEHLGIPMSVAKEIRANINQVQSLMDEILIKLRMGQDFPKRLKVEIQAGKLHGQGNKFTQAIHAFMHADLPLSDVMERRLRRILKVIPGSNMPQRLKNASV